MLRLPKKLIAGGVAALIAASWLIPVYGDICEKGAYAGQKDCAAYHISTVILWQIGEFLNYYGVAITAVATGAIGFFTYTLYKATTEQARLTRDSIEIARKEFVSTHRPKLRVRRFVPRLGDGLPITVHFMVVNVGDSAAHIKEIAVSIGLQTIEGVHHQPKIAPLKLQSIEGGQQALFICSTPDLVYSDEWGITRGVVGPSFEIRGVIEYADDNGVVRRTGFWRIRDIQGHMNKRTDPDGDYEYED